MRTILNETDARLLLDELSTVPNLFGLDTETVGIDPRKFSPVGRGNIFCWSLAWKSQVGTERAYLSNEVLPVFVDWFADPGVHKVGHNIFGFDRHMLANAGYILNGIVGDTLIMSKLAYNHPDARHGLKDLGGTLGYEMQGFKELFSRPAILAERFPKQGYTKRKVGDTLKVPTLIGGTSWGFSPSAKELIPLDRIPEDYPERLETLYEYASLDAQVTLELYDVLSKKLRSQECSRSHSTMLEFYDKVWNPSLYVLNTMEANGWDLDVGLCERGVVELSAAARELEGELHEFLGWHPPMAGINWDSTDQRVALLYGEQSKPIPGPVLSVGTLDLPIPPVCGSLKAIKRTRPGKTPTDAAALRWLTENVGSSSRPGAADFCGTLGKYRRMVSDIRKFRKFPEHVSEAGRIHYQLKPSTDSGRLAASNPPIQQVPKGGSIREAFTCPDTHSLIVVDYSALEMRVLAHFLKVMFKDTILADDLLASDFHQATADRLGITREMAKAVNYSVNYGKTSSGLAVQLRITRPKAEQLLADYYAAYPGIPRWQRFCESYGLRNGFVRTLSGRTRHLPELRSESRGRYGEGYRKAINTPIQGSAADLVTMAMLRTNTKPQPELIRLGFFQEELFNLGVEQVAQIHDEIVFRVPTANAELAKEIIVREMEQPMDTPLSVPFPVQAEIAQTWAEGK